MILPMQVFKDYSESYGKKLSLNLVPNNIINENQLIKGYYYGFSGEGIIHRLSTSWKTFHIVRYDGGIEEGYLNIHCLFSLFFNIDITNEKTIFWTDGFNNNIIRGLNNKLFYKLPNDNIRDMILKDSSLDDNKKSLMIKRLNEDFLNNSNNLQNLLCTICMTNQLNRVLPCGHTLCNACVENPGYNNCHMCRRIINNRNDIRPIYFG